MARRVLAFDVGTTALKAVIFDEATGLVASLDAAYPPADQPHRRDPAHWWIAVGEAAQALDRTGVEAIVLTGAMENLIAFGVDGAPTFPAILYSDPCGEPFLTAAADRLEGAAARIGNAPEPLMTAFKLMWFASREPDARRATTLALPGAKDALALRLTGMAATDPVTATTVGLMDLSRRVWDGGLVAALGLDPAILPPILPARAVLGGLTAEAARHLGLPEGLPVINGCGDAGATTLGSFCDEPGDISLYLGTSGWVARAVPATGLAEPRPVYRLAHPSEDLLIEVTPILSAGAAAAWSRLALGLSLDEAEALLAEADQAPPDLVFLPYLAGERSPFVDTQLRGAFLGLDGTHGPAQLAYAALEGVGQSIRINLEALDPGGSGRITIVGGGATSAIWPQLLADILRRPVHVAAQPGAATAIGAYRIAAGALGLKDAAAASSRRVDPRPDRRARADRLSEAFSRATEFARDLAPILTPKPAD